MLQSILKQFCMHLEAIPTAILTLNKQWYNGNERPQGGDILKELHSLMSPLERCFILLDGLDKCLSRQDLSEVIHMMLQDDSISLLITSWEANVFADTFHKTIDKVIALKGDGIDKEIYTYIEKSLETYRCLCKQGLEDKGLIQQTVVERQLAECKPLGNSTDNHVLSFVGLNANCRPWETVL